MNQPELTRTRVFLAFAIALIADLVQFPVTAVMATGFLSLPGEFADLVVDCVAMAATTMLLGFHWVLLPSLVLELVPGLDLVPTWTGCVAYVVWQRRKLKARWPETQPIIDVSEAKTAPEAPPASTSIDGRLERLAQLHRRQLITEAEFEAKRQQILREL
jgi:hypothetical protein